jgi:SAM-dependent methyltransferase
VDVQEKMLTALRKRAGRAALLNRIETRLCGEDAFGLSDLEAKLDFALAFAVVHEVSGPERFFAEIQAALKPGAKLLVAEPKGHVTEDAFARTVSIAQQAGLVLLERPRISSSRAALFARKG